MMKWISDPRILVKMLASSILAGALMFSTSGYAEALSEDSGYTAEAQADYAVHTAIQQSVYTLDAITQAEGFHYTGEPVLVLASASAIQMGAFGVPAAISTHRMQFKLGGVINFIAQYWQPLLLTLSVFFVGAASPGPSSLMILNVAISHGRKQGIALSVGVIAGEIAWAFVVVLGFLALIKTSATLFMVLNVIVGLYLLYLAFKYLKSCLSDWSDVIQGDTSSQSCARHFLKGLIITLTNPQVAMVWVATFSVSMEMASHQYFFAVILGLCSILAVMIYGGYAVLFSTAKVSKVYARQHKSFDFAISMLFGIAAIKVLSVATA